jgi:hypothetical protein
MEFIDSKYIEDHFQSLIAQADNFLHHGQISVDWKWVPSPPLYAPLNPVFDEIREISKSNGYEKVFSYPLNDNLTTNVSCIAEWPANATEFPNLIRKIGTYMSIIVFDHSADWVLLVDPDEIIFLGGRVTTMSGLKTTVDDIKKSILAEVPHFAFPLPNNLNIVPIDLLFKKCCMS